MSNPTNFNMNQPIHPPDSQISSVAMANPSGGSVVTDGETQIMKPTSPTLDGLPVEIAEKICTHLPAKAIGALRLTNRQLKADTQYIFERKTFQNLKHMLAPASLALLISIIDSKYVPRVQSLAIGPEGLRRNRAVRYGNALNSEMREAAHRELEEETQNWEAEIQRHRRDGTDWLLLELAIRHLPNLQTIRLDNAESPNDAPWVAPTGASVLLENIDLEHVRDYQSWPSAKAVLVHKFETHNHFNRVIAGLVRVLDVDWNLDIAINGTFGWSSQLPIRLSAVEWQKCQSRVRGVELKSAGGWYWSMDLAPFTAAFLRTCTHISSLSIETEQNFHRILAGRQWACLSRLVIRDSKIPDFCLRNFLQDHVHSLEIVIFDKVRLYTPASILTTRSGNVVSQSDDSTSAPLWPAIFNLLQEFPRLKYIEFHHLSSDKTADPIPKGPFIIVPWHGESIFELVASGSNNVREALRGAVGATRIAITEGWSKNIWYIYSTSDGKVMFPKFYQEDTGRKEAWIGPPYLLLLSGAEVMRREMLFEKLVEGEEMGSAEEMRVIRQ